MFFANIAHMMLISHVVLAVGQYQGCLLAILLQKMISKYGLCRVCEKFLLHKHDSHHNLCPSSTARSEEESVGSRQVSAQGRIDDE